MKNALWTTAALVTVTATTGLLATLRADGRVAPGAQLQAVGSEASGVSFRLTDSFQQLGEDLGVETRTCVSPLLLTAAGDEPTLVVHVEHVVRRLSTGEELAGMHLHRLVDPFGAEPVHGTVSVPDGAIMRQLDTTTLPQDAWLHMDPSSIDPVAPTTTASLR